ncbi:MAG: UDP-N-acetylmuramate dehydrogenase, partial [Planctomycetaceae bacterium]|nr:UDP-N-acetylmuramate dehydrogenase [Planctomycetaceae bacterium]
MERFKEFKNEIRANVPLAMHTWFQLGGPVQFFAEPKTEEELSTILKRCMEETIPVRILGAGSNIIIPDDGIPGMVISLVDACFCGIQIRGHSVTAGAGAKLGRVVTASAHGGLAGIENLVGLPGTIGGAILGNVSSSGDSIGQWITGIRVANEKGEVFCLNRSELSLNFEENFLRDMVILDVTLTLEEDDPLELAKRLQKIWIIKKTMFPLGHQCSGCIFRNPRGVLAGELIENAGLKGTRIGGAIVSDRNANFIVAEPECTSSDILRLIELVKNQVLDRTDIELET